MQKRSNMLCHRLLSSQDGLFSQEPAAPCPVSSNTCTLAVFYLVPLIFHVLVILPGTFGTCWNLLIGFYLRNSNQSWWIWLRASFVKRDNLAQPKTPLHYLIKKWLLLLLKPHLLPAELGCVWNSDNQTNPCWARPLSPHFLIHSDIFCSCLLALTASCSDTRANTCSHIRIQTWIVCEPCKV